ncbi:MAG: von Willebrand factor type A domain-containing protein, partial [Chthoniobacteraceae bacterium]
MNPDAPRTPREEMEIRLTALLMGELSPEDAAAWKALVAADPELDALHDRLRHAMELLREAKAIPEQPAPPVPARLSAERRAKLLAHFQGSAPAPERVIVPLKRDWKWAVPLGLAASLMALLGGTLWTNGFGLRKHVHYLETGTQAYVPDGAAGSANYRLVGNELMTFAGAERTGGSSSSRSALTQQNAIVALGSGGASGFALDRNAETRSGSEGEKRSVRHGTSDIAFTAPNGPGTTPPTSGTPQPKKNYGKIAFNNGGSDEAAPHRPVAKADVYLPAPEPAAAQRSSITLSSNQAVAFGGSREPRDGTGTQGPATAGSAVTLNGVTSLDLNGTSETVGTLTGGGAVTTPGNGTLTITNGNAISPGAPITGTPVIDVASGGVLNAGNGSLKLTGASTFTGGTTISAGTAVVEDSDVMGRRAGLARSDSKPAASEPYTLEPALSTDGIVLGVAPADVRQSVSATATLGGKLNVRSETLAESDSAAAAPAKTPHPFALTESDKPLAWGEAAKVKRASDFDTGIGQLADKQILAGSLVVDSGNQGRTTKGTANSTIQNPPGQPPATSLGALPGLRQKSEDDFAAQSPLGNRETAAGTPNFADVSGVVSIPVAGGGGVTFGNNGGAFTFGGAGSNVTQNGGRETVKLNLSTPKEAAKPDAPAQGRTIALKDGSGSLNNLSFPDGAFADRSFAGTISGAVNVTKSGADTWQFNGANSYTGATTIKAGTLTIAPAAGITGKLNAPSPESKTASNREIGLGIDLMGGTVFHIGIDPALDGGFAGKTDNGVETKIEELRKDVSAVLKPAPSPLIPQPEVRTDSNAFSTFSLNVSDVAFKLAAASLERGAMPDVSTLRSEEFINAFDYRDPEPAPGAPLAFASERARYPFAQNRDLLRLSVKTAAVGRQAGKPLNVVLLLDNSGSMERADRVRIVRESLRTLSAQLQPQDKLSIVTFSRTPHLWADGIAGDKAGEATARVGEITPEGGTNIAAALDLGYKTALRHYQVGSINHVVLLTDGAANLGDVDPAALKQKVEAHRKQGIALDCFGIGWEGLNDDMLEQLSRNGDGRYGFINTPEEAATNFAAQLAGALRVAASDVKVQVEFNPKRVTAYRQVGYAKHQLTKEQFRDNTVDAAELAAAESGNALY